MILPTTQFGVLLLAVASMLLLGAWANTFKAAGGKWRYELFYFDFALGMLLTAMISAFTLGSFGSELSFADNLSVTGKRQIGLGVIAGGVFNLANMLLMAGVSVAGLATAFLISASLTVSLSSVTAYFWQGKQNAALVLGGATLLLLAAVLAALAFSSFRKETSPSKKKLGIGKAIAVSAASGVLMTAFPPVAGFAKSGDIGLGPYTLAFTIAVGVFFSTFVFNIYFMNLPIEGQALSFGDYFRGNLRLHLLGLLGGAIWMAGATCSFLAASPAGDSQRVVLNPAVANLLAYAPVVVASLSGLLVWREFQGSSRRTRSLVWLSLLTVVVGIGLVSVAPLVSKP
ncbi:MAG: hypothetical protein NZV14_07180 [Bryobacteraceae bacterium]|nr:hypothetical protein [Bryobacteraceae bacterium]MDW8377926.1 hypothetical protein [Bryobacterales bacterium]